MLNQQQNSMGFQVLISLGKQWSEASKTKGTPCKVPILYCKASSHAFTNI
jgi:hypothetical protein